MEAKWTLLLRIKQKTKYASIFSWTHNEKEDLDNLTHTGVM